jgi:sugar phosphate isomerase/epimerase
MHIAIKTSALGESVTEALARAKRLGFTHVEVALVSAEFAPATQRQPAARHYRQLRQHIDQLGLGVWSVTLPALDPDAHKQSLLNAVGAAGILGARAFVVEPVHIFSAADALDAYLRTPGSAPPTVAGFDEAWAQVVNRRMTLALCNVEATAATPLINQPDRLGRAAFDLAIGVALDVPLALKQWPLDKWLTALAGRLAVTYVGVDSAETDRALAPENLIKLTQATLPCVVLSGPATHSDADWLAARQQIEAALPNRSAQS